METSLLLIQQTLSRWLSDIALCSSHPLKRDLCLMSEDFVCLNNSVRLV